MIRADWSGFVDRRPGPGDIVHTYMTGLGPVNGSMITGAPASLTSASPIQASFSCRFETQLFDPQGSDAEILFAGLAPGMTGIYQVSFRFPPDTGAAPLSDVLCVITNGAARVTLVYGLAQP